MGISTEFGHLTDCEQATVLDASRSSLADSEIKSSFCLKHTQPERLYLYYLVCKGGYNVLTSYL